MSLFYLCSPNKKAVSSLFLFEFHDDVLREISEFFSEKIQPALMLRRFLDSEFQLYVVGFFGGNVLHGQIGVDEPIVQTAAVALHRKFIKQTVLGRVQRPKGRGIIARSSSEIARTGKSRGFLSVEPYRDIAGPIVPVIGRFGTAFEGYFQTVITVPAEDETTKVIPTARMAMALP